MNSVRSPAPAVSIFNTNGRNNVFAQATNTVVNAANSVTNTMANAANTMVNAANTMANSVTNTANVMANTMTNSVSNTLGTNTAKSGPTLSQIMITILLIFIVILVGVFWRQIQEGFSVMYQKLRELFGANKEAPQGQQEETVKEIPQDDLTEEKKLVEKILPGRQQVFNISKNGYTYYDAEPLCKALGADLATYEQVKEAYAQGADWCNYGWVKGQMAVYPTQTDTWQKLQNGSEDQRDACGKPGVNGGFFDNPELKFGVSCYGVKPDQKDHDASAIAAGEGAPLSPGELEFEKKISQYRGDANHIAILPFNKGQWSH
jgi:hypothetical protein